MEQIDTSTLDSILRQTIQAVAWGKEEMFAVAESARREQERVQRELERVRDETRQIVDMVDYWQREEQSARRRLAEVSKDFERYSEDDMRLAYDHARDIQLKVALLREREKQFLVRRREMEVTCRQLQETRERAERLVSRVGVAMEFLSRSLQQIRDAVEQLQEQPETSLAIIRAQEEERRRIARGIHDGPAQDLTRLVMQAEYCHKLWEVQPDKLPPELDNLREQARANLEEIRRILFDLAPVDLSDGVAGAIERYLSDFRKRTGLTARLEVCGSYKDYSPQVEITVFRIVQEALNNVRKHAQATLVNVQLETQPQWLAATVADNGRGFEPASRDSRETFGLTIMRERANLVGGQLKIESLPGQGTIVSVRIEV